VPEVVFKALGDNSLDFLLRFWALVRPDRDHFGIEGSQVLKRMQRVSSRGALGREAPGSLDGTLLRL